MAGVKLRELFRHDDAKTGARGPSLAALSTTWPTALVDMIGVFGACDARGGLMKMLRSRQRRAREAAKAVVFNFVGGSAVKLELDPLGCLHMPQFNHIPIPQGLLAGDLTCQFWTSLQS